MTYLEKVYLPEVPTKYDAYDTCCGVLVYSPLEKDWFNGDEPYEGEDELTWWLREVKPLCEPDLRLSNILKQLRIMYVFYRLENDEEGFYFSIIDRQVYPRLWQDKRMEDGVTMIAETEEHLLKSLSYTDKDWSDRMFAETMEDLLPLIQIYITNKLS